MTVNEIYNIASQSLKEQKPFVVFRKPGESIIRAFLQKDTTSYYYDFSATDGFIMAPFDATEKAYFIPADNAQLLEARISLPDKIKTTKDKNPLASNLDLAALNYKELVNKAISSILNSNLVKVVVSRREEVSYEQKNLLEIFKSIQEKYPSAFCYLWYHPKTGVWAGATPEVLLRFKEPTFVTMALAGTRKYHESSIKEWGQKELEEQSLVTKTIVEILESYTSQLKINGPTTVKAGNVEHLKTIITGKLHKNNLDELIKKLHPTPAVCGTPLAKAKSFISENENYNREFYTGYLGQIHHKQSGSKTPVTELYVNLRCMKLSQTNAQIYVGGGITAQSNPEAEWVETVNKSNTMKLALLNIT